MMKKTKDVALVLSSGGPGGFAGSSYNLNLIVYLYVDKKHDTICCTR